GNIKPVMSSFDCKMIDIFPTSRQPMRGFVEKMKALEQSDPEILSISAIHGFMAGDVPEMGTHMVVLTNNNREKGDRVAKQLGMELFGMRGNNLFPQLSPAEAVSVAVAEQKRPVVMADVWDNPGGGTAGDATIILEEVLRQNVTNAAFGTIWDPIAVQICIAAGEGAEIPLRFGAKSAPGTGSPIDARVRVRRIVRDAHMRFGQSMVPFGDAVVIEFDGIEVVLNSTRAQCFDASLFATMGIEAKSKRLLVIKSTNHFFDSFDRIASRIIYCSAGTPYPNEPRTTPYLKAPRDIWPLVDNPHEKAE
ncbi:MAG TPA: M81 family peptidase, partial [Devosia sp.]|nr:M81 family peptidase [Devosia sp.]